MARIIGLDVGTSSTKGIVVDERGAVLRSVSVAVPLSRPHPLWSEQNPIDWVDAATHVLAELGSESVDAIGITGQMHGATFLDADFRPLRPAMLWNDQRTVDQCREIDEAVGETEYRRITRNPPMTGFQLPKILWTRTHEPEIYSKTRRVALPKDFVAYSLTGSLATDAADASGTGAFDVVSGQWSQQILDAVHIDCELFPKCAPFGESVGAFKGTPVFLAGGDQAAGGIGAGVVRAGSTSLSLGSSGVVFTATESPAEASETLNAFCHSSGGWLRMGVSLNCGTALEAFRERIAPSLSYQELDSLAVSAAPGPIALPYVSGERAPFGVPSFPWGFSSEPESVGQAWLAVLAGVSANLALIDQSLATGEPSRELVRVTGGGAKSPLWLSLLANLFERPMAPLAADEGPSFGAALLAGTGIGVWPSLSNAIESTVTLRPTIEPETTSHPWIFELKSNLAKHGIQL